MVEHTDKFVGKQRTLLDANGRKLVDPVTGESRRVDLAVFDEKTGTAKTYELTSLQASKDRQEAKEKSIFDRNPNGVFVRDPRTGLMYEVKGPSFLERVQ
jgi:hypothetical protein